MLRCETEKGREDVYHRTPGEKTLLWFDKRGDLHVSDGIGSLADRTNLRDWLNRQLSEVEPKPKMVRRYELKESVGAVRSACSDILAQVCTDENGDNYIFAASGRISDNDVPVLASFFRRMNEEVPAPESETTTTRHVVKIAWEKRRNAGIMESDAAKRLALTLYVNQTELCRRLGASAVELDVEDKPLSDKD